MTRVNAKSPTWRVKARALARDLEQVKAVSEERRKAIEEAWEIIRREREAVASPAAVQAEATPPASIVDELTVEAQKLGLYDTEGQS